MYRKNKSRSQSVVSRFIIQCATQMRGVIVSLDQYRDFLGLNPLWDETIKER